MTFLPDNIKDLLLPLGRSEKVGKGAVIILEGAPDDDVFYITKGRVRVVHINSDGGTTHLATFATQEIFGYFSFLTKSARTATVIADDDCDLVRVSGREFHKAFETHAELKNQLVAAMANEFLDTKDRLIGNKTMPAEKRIISLLKESIQSDGRVMTPRGWKTKQAEVLGLARENFSRHLSDMQKQGILEIHNDYIVFL